MSYLSQSLGTSAIGSPACSCLYKENIRSPTANTVLKFLRFFNRLYNWSAHFGSLLGQTLSPTSCDFLIGHIRDCCRELLVAICFFSLDAGQLLEDCLHLRFLNCDVRIFAGNGDTLGASSSSSTQ